MPPLINAQNLSKQFGSSPLFRNISLTIDEGDRIGLIGPNGSGKSTLLQMLMGTIAPDSGDVAVRKRTRVACVAQQSEFILGETVRYVAERALEQAGVAEAERAARISATLGRAGFTRFDEDAATLSGGWRKRLAIVEGLIQRPDVLLLDEPTNHLDLSAIDWLESVLQSAAPACVIVSHDRYLLENAATDIVELSRVYADGYLRVKGGYADFLEAKEAVLHSQGRRQESLANRVRTEMEWLRRGPKARATKAKARIDRANELIGELADLSGRSSTKTAKIDFTATGRQTKHLIELEQVVGAVPGRTLFGPIDFVIQAGMRVGLVGPNGSGKTTLLRLLGDEIQPSSGSIRRAANLRIVYFDQNRALNPEVSLRRALAPEGDSVVYQDRVIHVASWAERFLFRSEDLDRPVGRLSGGERARVLIAQLMLQPADVLLLDEPTNDLDIPTLEVLEESLREFRGALVLVTHDRYMLDRVSTLVLGLDGLGGFETFGDYSQWDTWHRSQTAPEPVASPTPKARSGSSPPSRKLSYLEEREFSTLEHRITEAENLLQQKRAALEDPAIASDGPRLLAAQAELDESQQNVDRLYARWAELDAKHSR